MTNNKPYFVILGKTYKFIPHLITLMKQMVEFFVFKNIYVALVNIVMWLKLKGNLRYNT